MKKILTLLAISCIASTAISETIYCPQYLECSNQSWESCDYGNNENFYKDIKDFPNMIYQKKASLLSVEIRNMGKKNQITWCNYGESNNNTSTSSLNLGLFLRTKNLAVPSQASPGGETIWKYLDAAHTAMTCKKTSNKIQGTNGYGTEAQDCPLETQ